MPLVISPEDYATLAQGDRLEMRDIRSAVESGTSLVARKVDSAQTIDLTYDLSDREREVLLAGGRLNFIRNRQA